MGAAHTGGQKSWERVAKCHIAVRTLGHLVKGAARFNELKRAEVGVSSKTLSYALDILEEAGAITRTQLAARPLRVSYALTSMGRELAVLVAQLDGWSDRWGRTDGPHGANPPALLAVDAGGDRSSGLKRQHKQSGKSQR